MPAQWSIVESDDDGCRIAVSGDLDVVDEPGLTATIDRAVADGAPTVVLDLGAVSFMDSSGVRTLVKARTAHGERFRLAAVSPAVDRVLEISGLHTLFDLPHGER